MPCCSGGCWKQTGLQKAGLSLLCREGHLCHLSSVGFKFFFSEAHRKKENSRKQTRRRQMYLLRGNSTCSGMCGLQTHRSIEGLPYVSISRGKRYRILGCCPDFVCSGCRSSFFSPIHKENSVMCFVQDFLQQWVFLCSSQSSVLSKSTVSENS